MSNLVHSPAGILAPPIAVTRQADQLKAQGFTIDSVHHGRCLEPEAKGRSGWRITLRDRQRIWFCWVFDVDMMADVQPVAVDVEIC
jgi:hypothetical protein